jgi:hypothetical protein
MTVKARVYRNLNNGLWSIQHKKPNSSTWQVVGYADAVTLVDMVVKQSAAGRDRARRDGKRNVHCCAEGTIAAVEGFTPLNDRAVYVTGQVSTPQGAWLRATYNPFKHDTIVVAATLAPITGARFARFTSTRKMDIAQ